MPHSGSEISSTPDTSPEVMSTSVASSMCSPTTSAGTPNVISLPASEAGAAPFALPAGPTIDLSGQAVAPASHSAPRAAAKAASTIDISGRTGSQSSRSAALQSSLGSKLQSLLGTPGSTNWQLIWKVRHTPLGRPYSQLSLSGRRISVRDFGLLPTPSGTSNHGLNHVAGRLDEWGGTSNQFRGTSLGKVHCPSFELWTMGYPETWRQQMPLATPLYRKSQRRLSALRAEAR